MSISPEQFEALITEHRAYLYNIARSYSDSREDAEDIVSEAVVRAWRFAADYEGTGEFKKWLLKIVDNSGRSHIRASQSRPRCVHLTDEGWADLEKANCVHQPDVAKNDLSKYEPHISDLEPLARRAFLLHCEQGATPKDVARVMGCTPMRANKLVWNAVRTLRRKLGAKKAVACAY